MGLHPPTEGSENNPTSGSEEEESIPEDDIVVVGTNKEKISLDIDGDGVYDKYDALLLLRYADNLHLYDPDWADDLLWENSQRTGAEIVFYLDTYFTDLKLFDLDGDGECDKYDALLLLRYTNNLHLYDPDDWTDDLLWENSQKTGEEIVAFIESLLPETDVLNTAQVASTCEVSEFSSQEEPAVVLFAAWPQSVSENRLDSLSELAETMRLRQMLDLDQSQHSEQTESVPFTDLIWSDDEWFGNEWLDFSPAEKETDFWSEFLKEDWLVSSL